MTQKQLSVAEIKAIAEGAITAKLTADNAKAALDADPDSADLKAAWDTADKAANDAKAKADALSQIPDDPDRQKKIDKAKKKLGYVKKELQDYGVDPDADEDTDTDEDDDDSTPVTRGDLKRIKAKEAQETAVQMADAIEDSGDKQAVLDALKRVVPSGDPQADFVAAVAIASAARNKIILEENGRKVAAPQHRMGAGGPGSLKEKFEPTADEARYMKSFGLSQEDILRARAQARPQQ